MIVQVNVKNSSMGRNGKIAKSGGEAMSVAVRIAEHMKKIKFYFVDITGGTIYISANLKNTNKSNEHLYLEYLPRVFQITRWTGYTF